MTLHHVELWVPDLDRAIESWGWLLTGLGYEPFQNWRDGRSWRPARPARGPYIVVERSRDLTGSVHDRRAPGLNHLAFEVGGGERAGRGDPRGGGNRARGRDRVDELTADAPAYGWRLLFADRHPYAGGQGHYASYLEDRDGYEVELVAT